MNLLHPRPLLHLGGQPIAARHLTMALRSIVLCALLGATVLAVRLGTYLALGNALATSQTETDIAIRQGPYPFIAHDQLVERTTKLEATLAGLLGAHAKTLAQVEPIVRLTQALPQTVRLKNLGPADASSGAPPGSLAIAGEAGNLADLNESARASLRRAGFSLTITSIEPLRAPAIAFSAWVGRTASPTTIKRPAP
ncbi:MAG: hypothetical protein ACHREM_28215 [Polyangiales bacterium]